MRYRFLRPPRWQEPIRNEAGQVVQLRARAEVEIEVNGVRCIEDFIVAVPIERYDEQLDRVVPIANVAEEARQRLHRLIRRHLPTLIGVLERTPGRRIDNRSRDMKRLERGEIDSEALRLEADRREWINPLDVERERAAGRLLR